MKLLPLWAVVQRDMLRMLRHRGRLLSAFVRPMIWFFVIGSGLGVLVKPELPGSYQRFLLPGVLGMTILFSAMLIALSVVYDKEFGVMRLLVTVPLPQPWVVFAKIVSGTFVGTVQAVAIFVLLALLGYTGPGVSLPLLFLAIVATALACASLGMIVAAWTSTLDNFAVVMNFVIFPVFFLSGALYPVNSLSWLLRFVAMLNPFSYGVDLLKHALLSGESVLAGTEFVWWVDLLVLLGFSAGATLLSSFRFSHELRAGAPGFLSRFD
jgi:ABC-2 type transport system permease protein